MTRISAGTLALVTVSAMAIAGQPTASIAPQTPNGTAVVSIIGTNDLHGGIVARDGRGGFDVFAGYVRNVRAARARDAGAVLLIDAGDMFQGTLESNLTEGASVVSAYNALGYAAAAVGNHEFDFGPVGPAATPREASDDPRGALKARAAEAQFPFLAANLIDEATGRPVTWPNVRPSTIVRSAGFAFGIVGVITRDALATTIAGNTRGLRVAPLGETIQSEAALLRAQGADVVVVAAHAGGRCTRFDAPTDVSSCDVDQSEIADVVRQLPRGTIDVVVAGHTHAGIAHEINGVRIIESFNAGRAFGRIDLTIDRATRRIVAQRSFPPQDICARVDASTSRCDPDVLSSQPLVDARYEGETVAADPAITAVLRPALDRVRELKLTQLGVTLDTPIRRAPVVAAESPLGNLFADAFLASRGGVDVVINNTSGGLRTDLPAGPLTYGALFEVFPFDNMLVRLTLSGAELRRVFVDQLQQSRLVPGIAGLYVRANCNGPTLAVTMLRPSGRPVEDADRLSVVTTDFLATGGDRVFASVMPAGGFNMDVDRVARDVVADWLRQRGGRLRDEQFVDREHRRWTYPGEQPVRCPQ